MATLGWTKAAAVLSLTLLAACDMRSTTGWDQYPPGRDPGYDTRELYQVPGCKMKLLYVIDLLRIDCPRSGYRPPS